MINPLEFRIASTGKSSREDTLDISKFPSTQQLYALYGYTPPSPPTAREGSKIELTAEIEGKILEVAERILTSIPSPTNIERVLISKDKSEIPNVLIGVSNVINGDIEDFKIEISDEGQFIANFYLSRDIRMSPATWELTHRKIAEGKRGQGLGSQILSLMERAIQNRADNSGVTQRIVIVARQIGVVTFAIKSGYTPETEEDIKNLRMLNSGDKSQVRVMTTHIGTYAESIREGYMVSVPNARKLLPKSLGVDVNTEMNEGEIVKSMNHGVSLKNFIDMALTINFQKELKPTKPLSTLR